MNFDLEVHDTMLREDTVATRSSTMKLDEAHDADLKAHRKRPTIREEDNLRETMVVHAITAQ